MKQIEPISIWGNGIVQEDDFNKFYKIADKVMIKYM